MNVICNTIKKEKISDNIKSFKIDHQFINIWEHPRIWTLKSIKYCSKWLIEELNRIKLILLKFIDIGYSNHNNDGFDYFFLRNLKYWLIEKEDFLEALFKVNGWQGRLGLEIAASKLRYFFAKNKRFPKTKDKGMIRIRNSVLSTENWKDLGILSWDDLLIFTFGEKTIKEWQDLKEKKKFQKAIKELNKFYKKEQRLPKYSDKEIYWISGAVSKGIWKKYGIDVWNDLLKHVFGKVNVEYHIYDGIEGLKKAKEELLNFNKKYNKLPTSKDFESMAKAIYRGIWEEYSIITWNDLLRRIFGEVNLNLQKEYMGDDILLRIREELKNFVKQKGRLPKSNDKEMGSIISAIGRGVLKKYGIRTWNDLLKSTFGKINRDTTQYHGIEGLKKAIIKLKKFKEKHKREPNTGEMDTIYRTAIRGEWKEFNILNWDNLLDFTYGRYNREINRYKGRIGLNNAVQELKKYREKYGKKPISNMKGMRVIYNTINRGEWKEFGINSWNDLLLFAFGEIYYEKNKYKGIRGLERAKQVLEDFKNINGKIPSQKNKGMGGIVTAIGRGEWKEFGIHSWNDLLKLKFGEINYQPNKYLGKKGLNTAIKKLRDFKKKYGKKPTSHSKGMNGIIGAIGRGEWNEFGIYSWNDLLKRTFREINFEPDKYKGRQGFERAIQELRDFKNKYGKKPTSNTKGFSGIYKIIQQGRWKKYNINSWNDLLMHTFGEIYIETNKYKGKLGLKRAIQELKEFKIKYGRIPIIKDKGMGGIVNAILREEWKGFEINSWNDLLITTFKELNKEKNKYLGKEGFKRAIQELKDYKKKYGKIPSSKSKGIFVIYNNARLGKMKEFGVNNWNDLLKIAFGTFNQENNKYIGEKGLERAKSELREFKRINGKIPTSKSMGIKTIYKTARLGKWKEFGINNWHDLLFNTFHPDEL